MGGGFSAGANNLNLLDETKSCVLLGCWARMTKLTWAGREGGRGAELGWEGGWRGGRAGLGLRGWRGGSAGLGVRVEGGQSWAGREGGVAGGGVMEMVRLLCNRGSDPPYCREERASLYHNQRALYISPPPSYVSSAGTSPFGFDDGPKTVRYLSGSCSQAGEVEVTRFL